MTIVAAFPNLVIRASAGTGKTFQLSNRFLGLVAGGQPPEQILASTFARKAAGEILERVMTRLAEAAGDDDRRAALAQQIGRPALDRGQCLALLRELIGRLHRLQIGTLDSFFVQLAGRFSLELGLPLGWRIIDELDDRKLRTEAVRQVLQNNPTSDSVRLVHLLSKGEATRSVTRQIQEVVDGMYDLFLDSDQSHWEQLPREKPLDEAALADALTRLAELSDFPNDKFREGWQKNLEAAEIRDWDRFISNGVAKCIVLGQKTYCSKPIEVHIDAAYRPLIDHVGAELVTRLANQTAGTWTLLKHFDEAYRRLKAADRALRFDDVTRALGGELSSRGVEQLGYRLDGPLAHLLLDEFQDTSLAQWRVLKPFADRVVSSGGGRSFFCVGDAKQAIYGWRGGVAEIFDSAVNELPGLTEQSLVESFRSSPVVIDTINQVFGHLSGNEALEDWPEAIRHWHGRYETHRTARGERAGRCRLLVAGRAADGEKQDVATLKFAAAHVAELARQHPERTIGVLVRRNTAVARMIFELRSGYGVLASEEGGNPLTDSVAVQLVLSLLKLADHPGDTAARFHVAKSPLGRAIGFEQHDSNAAARELALAIRNKLVCDGYGRTVSGWVKSLAPACEVRDLNRLLQLVEMAYRFDDGRIHRPDDFIARIDVERVEDPTAARVRVMTVHQAKGLQFDIVVLPELDCKLKGQPPAVVVDRETPLGPVNCVCRYTNETIQKLLPERFQKMFDAWAIPLIEQSLCVLYVAMTRAIHALDMIIAPSKSGEKKWPKTCAGLIRGALAPGKPAEPQTTAYEHGNPVWWKKGATDLSVAGDTTSGHEQGTDGRQSLSAVAGDGESAGASGRLEPPVCTETIAVKLPPTGRRRRGLDYRTPSSLEGCGKVDLRRSLRLESLVSMTRGSIMHAWFELIEWLENGPPSDDELQRAAGPLVTPEIDLSAEIRRFREMLSREAIAAVLRRSQYEGLTNLSLPGCTCDEWRGRKLDVSCRREHSFAVRHEDALVFGTVDRLTLFRDAGRVVAVDILDFKTDAIETPVQIAERIATYRPQIQAYRQSIAALSGVDQDHISARLLFVEPGVVEAIF